MISAEVWIGLAVVFGSVWILVRVLDSRRTAARIRVTADTVPAAHRLTQAFLRLTADGQRLRDISGLPGSKPELAQAMKTMLSYHAVRGEHGQVTRLRAAYLSLADFQELGQDLRRAEATAESERRRLLLDLEHHLASTSL